MHYKVPTYIFISAIDNKIILKEPIISELYKDIVTT